MKPLRALGAAEPSSCPPGRHLIHLAQNWQNALKTGLVGGSSEIAEQCGLSPRRVRQIVQLAQVAPPIAEFLAKLEGRKALRGLSEARIRSILALDQMEQIRQFEARIRVRLPR